MTTKTPDEIVSQVVLDNYGPEGDAELYEMTQGEYGTAEPSTVELLTGAAFHRFLDGDGVRALMRAAVEADRAQIRTLAAQAHDAITQIEESAEADGMDEVFEARDNAGDVLHRFVAYSRGVA